MFKALFNIIINLLATVIQLICWPVNAVITTALPDISSKLLEVSNSLNNLFDSMTWALGLLPQSLIEVLLFILTIEIAKHTIFKSTYMLLRVWNVFQKIKFW